MTKQQSQFIHLDTYARVVPKASTQQQWTAFDVLREAERDADHCKHVKQPERPEVLFSKRPKELIALIERYYVANTPRFNLDPSPKTGEVLLSN